MIPKIIHQTWRSDKLPSIFQKIYNRNKTLNPEFEFKLWSHSPGPPDIDNFIEKEYPDIYEIYKKTKYGVQKADIARLAVSSQENNFARCRPCSHKRFRKPKSVKA